MELSKEQVIEFIGKYLTRNLSAADFLDGWPEGAYVSSREPVWSVPIPSDRLHVGGCRFLVILKSSGRIVADRMVGE
jgi:hypothetical protein